MKIFKLGILTLSSIFAVAAFTPMLHALPIDAFTATVGTGATQMGRLSRGGIPQTWLHTEAYPGFINTTTAYNYKTFTYTSAALSGGTYIDISVYDDTNATTFFLSAYANSYNPSNPSLNWLGDEGSSGNVGFPGNKDAFFFDVILPVGGTLVLVANNTSAGGVGNNAPFDIAINAYSDTNYTDPVPAPTPEPSSFVLLGTGMVGFATALRRRIALRA